MVNRLGNFRQGKRTEELMFRIALPFIVGRRMWGGRGGGEEAFYICVHLTKCK